ncbi:MAG: hypothetical protein QXY83_02670 [Thermosphaera sp.]
MITALFMALWHMYISHNFITPLPVLPFAILTEGIFTYHFQNKNAGEKLDQAIQACGDQRYFVIARPDIGLGAHSYNSENVAFIDLWQEAARAIRQGFLVADGNQKTFVNEPRNSTLVAADSVPADVDHEQNQAIAGLIDSSSPNLNAVGCLGRSARNGWSARIWFFQREQ